MKRTAIAATLPVVFGLPRVEAAAAIGVSATLFDQMVDAGRMPPPRQPSPGRVVWDVDELRAAFKALPHASEPAEAEDTWSDI